MNKHIITSAIAFAAIAGQYTPVMAQNSDNNPFLAPYATAFNIPPFESIKYSHYLPAIKKGIEQKAADVAKIADNPAEPDFENTILALEKSGALLERVMGVFSNLDETNSSPEMVEISEIAYPLVSQSSDEIMMNPKLFARVKKVYDNRNS